MAILCALRWRWLLITSVLTGSFGILSVDSSNWQISINFFVFIFVSAWRSNNSVIFVIIFATILSVVFLCMLRWRWLRIIGVLTGSFGILSIDSSSWQISAELFTAKVMSAWRSNSSVFVSGVAAEGLTERKELWSRAWDMIQDSPLSGIGMGCFNYVANMLYPPLPPLLTEIPHAHNLFLQVAVDLGVPGLIAYLFTLALITMMVVSAYMQLGKISPGLKGLAAGILASQLVLVAHGMFDAVTWGMVRPALLIWAIWGSGAALWRLVEMSRETEELVRPGGTA
jgi:putative inorganic carbon (HCO3(-)) transporter